MRLRVVDDAGRDGTREEHRLLAAIAADGGVETVPQLRVGVFHQRRAEIGRQEHLTVGRHRRGDERIVEHVHDPDRRAEQTRQFTALGQGHVRRLAEVVGTRIRVIRMVSPPRKDCSMLRSTAHATPVSRNWRSSDCDRATCRENPTPRREVPHGPAISTGRLIPTVPPSFEPVTVQAQKLMRARRPSENTRLLRNSTGIVFARRDAPAFSPEDAAYTGAGNP